MRDGFIDYCVEDKLDVWLVFDCMLWDGIWCAEVAEGDLLLVLK